MFIHILNSFTSMFAYQRLIENILKKYREIDFE